MSHVRDVLANKGFNVETTDGQASVLEATNRMNDAKIGALVVADEGQKVIGIFTERDVLQRVVAPQKQPDLTKVQDVMTRQVICVTPDTDLDEARNIMRQRRIRHLPVVNDRGELVGMISIGDLNAHAATNREVHITFLEEYIYGRV